MTDRKKHTKFRKGGDNYPDTGGYQDQPETGRFWNDVKEEYLRIKH